MLAASSDAMQLGLDSAEAFGQSEALTTRLKHIIDVYADGPGVLMELIQNADDAGATQVSFLLDRQTYPANSVLGEPLGHFFSVNCVHLVL
jgi:sacsin